MFDVFFHLDLDLVEWLRSVGIKTGVGWPAVAPGLHLKPHENQTDTREAVCSDLGDRVLRAIARQCFVDYVHCEIGFITH